MTAHRIFASAVLVLPLLAGCGTAPGQPGAEITPAPADVADFNTLYAENCAACHGPDGRGGAAIALANPVYLAIVDDGSMRGTVASGVRGTSMPAFATHAGGMLTDHQLDALVNGMRSRWSRPSAVADANAPSYTPTSAGDPHRGAAAYETFCESCHGADGAGGPHGSAITNDSFLALTSDQALRTMVIAGRPELGCPDWRGYLGGSAADRVDRRPMSDQDVTDVVSWLTSHRTATPGQPYATAQRRPGGSREE